MVIHKYHQKTQKFARVILFSTNLELEGQSLVNYYRLRFQIEFNFRDAKQHWGLEDFMVNNVVFTVRKWRLSGEGIVTE